MRNHATPPAETGGHIVRALAAEKHPGQDTARLHDWAQEEVIKGAQNGREVADGFEKIADAIAERRDAMADLLPEDIARTTVSPDIQVDPEAVEQTMRKTAEDVREILDATRTEELEEGVAGQAMLGQEGTATIDVAAVLEGEFELGESMIDTEKLKDVVAHEERHEWQSQTWDTQSVDVDGETFTVKEFVETDAMAQQEKIDWVSDDYQRMRQRVLRVFTEEQVAEIAETGELSRAPEIVKSKAA